MVKQNKTIEQLVAENPALKAAQEYGVDVQALVDNLNRSVEERIRRHQISLNLFQQIHNIANEK